MTNNLSKYHCLAVTTTIINIMNQPSWYALGDKILNWYRYIFQLLYNPSLPPKTCISHITAGFIIRIYHLPNWDYFCDILIMTDTLRLPGIFDCDMLVMTDTLRLPGIFDCDMLVMTDTLRQPCLWCQIPECEGYKQSNYHKHIDTYCTRGTSCNCNEEGSRRLRASLVSHNIIHLS